MYLLLILDEDQNIIAAIYEKHYKRMLYTSTKILGNAKGEEALHDSFVKLIERYEKNISILRDKPALFFVIVVRNHSLNILRKESSDDVALEDELIFSDEADLEERIIASDTEAALVGLIKSLNPTMREILEYKYILEYSNKEIAEILGLTQTAVSSRIDRAKNALKKKIEERGLESFE